MNKLSHIIRRIARAPDKSTPARSIFNLRLWFGVSAFAIIAAMGTGFGIMLTQFISNGMLEREAVVTRNFLESIIWAEESGAAVFSGTPVEQNPPLASFVMHIRSMPDMVRANLYARTGLIVWSTDASIIGRRFVDNHELDKAYQGQLVTEIGTIAGEAKSEHVNLDVDAGEVFIEAYMPLRNHQGQVLGVAELYKIPTALNATIRDGQRMIWVAVASAMLLLFVTLFWIVQRGARIIERQQAELGQMAALAALGQMAGAIAHSMRNPLAGVRGSAELLRLDHPQASEAADDIIGQVDRMDLYVRELLDYARADSPATQELDPGEVVRATLVRFRALLDRNAIAVALRDDRDGKAGVMADPQLLGQALGNVITNAVEAMGHGGGLAIVLAQSGRFVSMTITDTGPGIPPEARARITDAFYTTKTRGLGLGLALTRQIIERFGGTMDIPPPPPSGGTSIRLTLPLTRPS